MNEEEVVSVLLQDRVRICAILWMMVHDSHTTDDLFQDVVVKALKSRDTFHDATHLSRWARTTARHRAIDHLRHRNIRTKVLNERALDLMEAHIDNQTRSSLDGRIDALRDCLQNLPERSRRLLERRYHHQEKATEIAHDRGVSAEALYQQLSRLQRSLRQCVETRLNSSSTS